VQAGSPVTEFEDNKDVVKDIIIADAIRTVQNRITANRGMIDGATARFIAGSKQAKCSDTRDETLVQCPEIVGRANVAFDVDGTLTVAGGDVASQGVFFGESAVGNGNVWRVVSGDFTLNRAEDGSSSAMVSGRVAWEHQPNEDLLWAYFIAGDFQRSDVKGAFNGGINSYGLSGGGYVVNRLSENLYVDGYASLGYSFSNMDLSNGILDLDGKQSGATLSFGGSLTGVYAQKSFEIWPKLSLDYAMSELGQIDFDASAYGLTDTVSLDAGSVSVLQLSFTPEFKVGLNGKVEALGTTSISAAPSLACQVIRSDTQITQACGYGASLGISHRSLDSLTKYEARIAVRKIGDNTQSELMLKLEKSF
jgi:hypothetical protein